MTKKSKYKKVKLAPALVQESYKLKQPKKTMEINSVNIYGSAAFLVGRIPRLALRIDLSGLGIGDTQLVDGNNAAFARLPKSLFTQRVPLLTIDWADGTAHTLDVTWWQTLIGAIEKLPDGSSVGVCCMGGTGRTGTVLAILAALSGQLGFDEDVQAMETDPVAWVRRHYYDDAVETEEQLWYIEDITGLMTAVYPSSPYQTMISPHGTQVLGIPDVSQSQATVTGPLVGPASVGASDHTGS